MKRSPQLFFFRLQGVGDSCQLVVAAEEAWQPGEVALHGILGAGFCRRCRTSKPFDNVRQVTFGVEAMVALRAFGKNECLWTQEPQTNHGAGETEKRLLNFREAIQAAP